MHILTRDFFQELNAARVAAASEAVALNQTQTLEQQLAAAHSAKLALERTLAEVFDSCDI